MSRVVKFLASLLRPSSWNSRTGQPGENSSSSQPAKAGRKPSGCIGTSEVFPNWDRGRLIGGVYEIQRRLGRGGFAVVFLARERVTGQLVAIKVPFPHVEETGGGKRVPIHFASNPGLKRVFIQEVRTWMSLAHPHVVEAFDVRDDDSTDFLPAICMQYCAGGSLQDLLKKRSREITLACRLDIAIQICWALEYIHREGFLHRDLKAANVLLANREPDKPPYALVSDLGLVTALDRCLGAELPQQAEGDHPGEVTVSRVCGTITHLAPEAWVAGARIGPAVDVYAFGVLLYEIFCNRLPFCRGNFLPWDFDPLTWWKQVHHSASRPDPRTWNRDLPRELGRLMMSCLEVDPQARPNISEVESVLRKVYSEVTGQAHEEIRPKPDSAKISELAARQRAWARIRLGVGSGRRGDFAEAEREFGEAELTFQQLSDLRGLAAVRTNRAIALAKIGRLTEALQLHQEAGDFYRILGDLRTLGYCYGNQAVVLEQLGRSHEALELLRDQQELFKQVKDFANLALSYAITASVKLGCGDREGARHALRRAWRLTSKVKDRLLLSQLYLRLALVVAKLGKYRRALKLLQHQEALSVAACDPAGLIDCYGIQASIHRHMRNLEQALRLHRLEQTWAERIHDWPALARSFLNESELLSEMGDIRGAKTALAKAKDTAERHRLIQEWVASLVNEGLILVVESGGRPFPERQFEQAEEIARQAGLLTLVDHVRELRKKVSEEYFDSDA